MKSDGRLDSPEGMGTYAYLQKRAIERSNKKEALIQFSVSPNSELLDENLNPSAC